MSKDLVKRLREGTNGTDVTKTDEVLTAYMQEAADRIEELETKLAMAVEAFGPCVDMLDALVAERGRLSMMQKMLSAWVKGSSRKNCRT